MATKRWVSTSSTDWATAANWSPSGVPADNDDVVIENNAVNIDTGLDQTGIELTSLTIAQSYTGRIGTATEYLIIEATTVDIGRAAPSGTPSGSDRIKLNLLDAAAAIRVHNTSTGSADDYLPPVQLLTAHASATLRVDAGSVGLAVNNASETSTIGTVTAAGGDVVIGAGVTITTLQVDDGECTLNAGATTATVDGGTLELAGTGTVTTLTVNGGTVNVSGARTITTANLYGGTTDLTAGSAAKTITTCNLKQPAMLTLDSDDVTLTNKIAPSGRITISARAA